VLHPQSLSPIHITSCELQSTNTWETLVHKVMLIIKHQNHLAKWPGVHFLTGINDNTYKLEFSLKFRVSSTFNIIDLKLYVGHSLLISE
jgi:hypothetical protein